MKRNSQILSLILISFALLLSICACSVPVDNTFVRVAVENGEHYTVIGEKVKRVTSGDGVSFVLQTQEGYTIFSNDNNVSLERNVDGNLVVSLQKVYAPQTIVLQEALRTFTITLTGNGITPTSKTVSYGDDYDLPLRDVLVRGYGYVSNNKDITCENETLCFVDVKENVTVEIATERNEYYVTVESHERLTNEIEGVWVAVGGNVDFTLNIEENYYFANCNYEGNYYLNSGTLTLYGISSDCTVELTLRYGEAGTIYLVAGDGFTSDDYDKKIEGGTVVFNVEISEDYSYEGNSLNGVYDSETKTLTISNLTHSSNLSLQLRQEYFYVTIFEGVGYEIQGETQKRVKRGESATFNITLLTGYIELTNDGGATYENGVLSFSNVTVNKTVDLAALKEAGTAVFLDNGKYVRLEEPDYNLFTATAAEGYYFSYWTYNDANNEAQIYSYANNIVVPQKELQLTAVFFANTVRKVVYHANGGALIDSEDTTVTQSTPASVYLYASSFGEWFFKTFEREGYVPLEYNTREDGSGTAISLGSKVLSDMRTTDIYIIWQRETSATSFYYDYVVNNNERVAVALTKYNGDAETVAIPTTIDNLPVQQIKGGCFENNATMRTVVVTKNVVTVEDNAFNNCSLLSTFYFCDSVESITNESVVNCNELANIRVIAVFPPIHADNLIASSVRRIELLYQTRNSDTRNILTYGGSGMYQSIDGGVLYERFGSNRRVINCGQNAYVSGPLMLEVYGQFMQAQDVMTAALEYNELTYSTRWHIGTWISIELFYDAFRYIDARNYSRIFTAFYEFQHGDYENFAYVSRLEALSEGEALTYDDYATGLNEYFTRNYNANKVPNAVVTKDYQFETIKLCVAAINAIYDRVYHHSTGKYLFMSYPAVCYDTKGTEDTSDDVSGFTNELSDFEDYDAFLRANLEFPVISDYNDCFFEEEYIYDDPVHLTSVGAVENSKRLAEDIRTQMVLMGLTL